MRHRWFAFLCFLFQLAAHAQAVNISYSIEIRAPLTSSQNDALILKLYANSHVEPESVISSFVYTSPPPPASLLETQPRPPSPPPRPSSPPRPSPPPSSPPPPSPPPPIDGQFTQITQRSSWTDANDECHDFEFTVSGLGADIDARLLIDTAVFQWDKQIPISLGDVTLTLPKASIIAAQGTPPPRLPPSPPPPRLPPSPPPSPPPRPPPSPRSPPPPLPSPPPISACAGCSQYGGSWGYNQRWQITRIGNRGNSYLDNCMEYVCTSSSCKSTLKEWPGAPPYSENPTPADVSGEVCTYDSGRLTCACP
jgi:hypothetical protein